ncbi:MAG: class I SAM-dependent methyltransferase [Sphingobacteriales bacterium]|nr:MAG: class I SAM-dependent methyltransferase [Sphingobacteriales bacterium]
MQDNSAKIFSDNWNLYQKVVRLNYMHHAEFTGMVTKVFDEFKQQTVDVLDIGCGDAEFLKMILQKHSINSYTGYDLSDPALQIASDNLNQSSFDVSLKQGDMLELIQQETKTFDIIHAGFAIHHLQDDDKMKMWEACFKLLNTAGKMIYTDVFRKTGVGRNEYLVQYLTMMEEKWTELNSTERGLICNHVSQYDFPSELATTIKQLEKTGFTIAGKLEPDDFHIMLILKK